MAQSINFLSSHSWKVLYFSSLQNFMITVGERKTKWCYICLVQIFQNFAGKVATRTFFFPKWFLPLLNERISSRLAV